MAKASAKVVTLDKPYSDDCAILDNSSGKSTVSEIRFAGKKYALAIGNAQKAEMSGSN